MLLMIFVIKITVNKERDHSSRIIILKPFMEVNGGFSYFEGSLFKFMNRIL